MHLMLNSQEGTNNLGSVGIYLYTVNRVYLTFCVVCSVNNCSSLIKLWLSVIASSLQKYLGQD